jgi:hypothetical protein
MPIGSPLRDGIDEKQHNHCQPVFQGEADDLAAFMKFLKQLLARHE